ncbi:hypothetical protein ACNKHN_03445 [Shigella flexneri]
MIDVKKKSSREEISTACHCWMRRCRVASGIKRLLFDFITAVFDPPQHGPEL